MVTKKERFCDAVKGRLRLRMLVVGCLHLAAPELEVAVVIHFFLFCPFLVLPAG